MNEQKPKIAKIAHIPMNVMDDEKLSPRAVTLYGRITALSYQKGYCFAKNDYFAQVTGKSERSVSGWVTELVDAGHIKRELILEKGTKHIIERRLHLTDKQFAENQNIILMDLPGKGMEKNFYTPMEKNFHTLSKKTSSISFKGDLLEKESIKEKTEIKISYGEDSFSFDTSNFSKDPNPPESEFHLLQDLQKATDKKLFELGVKTEFRDQIKTIILENGDFDQIEIEIDKVLKTAKRNAFPVEKRIGMIQGKIMDGLDHGLNQKKFELLMNWLEYKHSERKGIYRNQKYLLTFIKNNFQEKSIQEIREALENSIEGTYKKLVFPKKPKWEKPDLTVPVEERKKIVYDKSLIEPIHGKLDPGVAKEFSRLRKKARKEMDEIQNKKSA